jgi:hypothetical protein
MLQISKVYEGVFERREQRKRKKHTQVRKEKEEFFVFFEICTTKNKKFLF